MTSPGHTVYALPDTYPLVSTITLRLNNITLAGYGGGVVLICETTDFTAFVMQGSFNGMRDVTLRNCGQNFEVVGESTVLQGITFMNNTLPVVSEGSKNFRIDNCTFDSGGAVNIRNSINAAITNSHFSGNTGDSNGGALVVSNSTLTIASSAVSSNTAQHGGAFYLDTSTTTISGCSFAQNEAVEGGAIRATNSQVALNDNTFTSNTATYGGAIHADASSSIADVASIFQNNIAFSGGACNLNNLRNISFANSSFVVNKANYTSGGALNISSSKTAQLKNCSFKGNSAALDGAGVLASNSTLNVFNSLFLSNTAKGNGGAISLIQSSGTDTNSLFDKNAASIGGGLYIYTSTTTLTSSTFTNNTATMGGGMAVYNSSGTSTSVTIESNSARMGGGVYLQSAFSFITSNITRNAADQEDGIYIGSSEAEIGLRVTDTYLTNVSPFMYCCEANHNVTTGSILVPTLCQYPACGAQCSISGSCKCNLGASFTCGTCESPLTGPFCSIQDQCKNYSFCEPSACVQGFGYNFTCEDTRNCYINNGGCDFHTTCTVINGAGVCGACPLGFLGNGYDGCQAQCGNGNCEAIYGEDCVSCRVDCNTTCEFCGDTVCGGNETCSSCSDDCGTCEILTCPGTPECSGQGTCKRGTCECDAPWGGPQCDQNNAELNITLPISAPGRIGIKPELNPTLATFTITTNELREVDQNGNTVTSMDLTTKNLTFVLLNSSYTSSIPRAEVNKPCANCLLSSYVRVSAENNSFSQWVSEITLANNATIEFMIWQFSNNASVTFANMTTQEGANTLKLAIQIRNWPFQALHHSLAIVLGTKADDSSKCKDTRSAEDSNDDLKWLTINMNGATLYGQFADRAIVDGVARSINFKLLSDGSVSAKIPHFWVNSVVDPSYTMLLGAPPASCHASSGLNVKVLVASIVPAVVFAGTSVVVAIVVIPKIHRQMHVRKANKSIASQKGDHKNAALRMRADSVRL